MTRNAGTGGRRDWSRSVIYQVYPRSFSDSNGDGIGDLRGLTSRLDYLSALGVDIVWICPVYASPNRDNGYDISDYRAIHPDFGTMADFDAMLAAMHARGMRLMMDLVVNHTSDAHAWFEAAKSSRDDPHHDFYIWADAAQGCAPNNWEAAFGGSAWTWNAATREYYLHLFSHHQPDLNWDNPRVRAEVYALMRFWLDKGVDGFRMDVVTLIAKPRDASGRLPDAPRTRAGDLQPAFDLVSNCPRLLDYLGEMKREVLDHYDVVTVGEAPGISPERARLLTDARHGPLDMLFQFDHVDIDTQPGRSKWHLRAFSVDALRDSLSHWQAALADHGWNSLYFNNHDQPRAVSRFGDDVRWRDRSAKMLGLLLHGMKGTPFVYQGEELGMRNAQFSDIRQCRDVESLNFYHDAIERQGWNVQQALHAIRAKGRDNARTPMRWNCAANAGFSAGVPWMEVPPDDPDVNAETEMADPDSVFHFYRRLIALRRTCLALVEGRYELLLPDHPDVFAYARRHAGADLLVLCNMCGREVAFAWSAPAVVLLANTDRTRLPDQGDLVLEPYEAVLAVQVREPVERAAAA